MAEDTAAAQEEEEEEEAKEVEVPVKGRAKRAAAVNASATWYVSCGVCRVADDCTHN
jgi:hypothetical protein